MIAVMIAGLAQQTIETIPATTPPAAGQEVVVTGKRRRGEIDIDIKPIQSLDADAMQAIGASDLKDVLDRIAPTTRSADNQQPLMIVNGRVPVEPSAVFNLPFEAVERVDTYPEAAAAKFGFPPTRKVLNFVFKRQYRAVIAEGWATATTDGGRSEPSGSLTLARIREDTRTNLRARYRRAAELRADERRIVRDPAIPAQQSDGVSLVPAEEEIGLSATAARAIGKTATGSVSIDVERRRSGLAAGVSSGEAAAVTVPAGVALRRRSVATKVEASSSAAGAVDGWGWNAKVKAQTRDERTRLGAAQAQSTAMDRLFTGNVAAVDGTVTASRVAFTTGAGSATVDASIQARWDRAENSTAPGAVGAVRRIETGGAVGARIPLTSTTGPFAAFLGDVALNARADLRAASTADPFLGGSGGIEWQLWQPVRLSVTAGYARTLPDVAILATPRVETPNVPFFDFTNGDTGLVTTIAGGNPALRPARRRTLSATAEVKPFAESEFLLTVGYEASDTHDAVGAAVALTADSQPVFPDLFVRDATGRVRIVRQTPVNLFRSLQDQIDLGFSFHGPIGPKPDPAAKGPKRQPIYAYANGSLSFRLTDTVQLAPGVAPRDLLAGATVDGLLGRPSRTASVFGGLYHRGIGLNTSITWQGRSRISGADPAADLRFSSLTKVSLEASIALDRLKPKWTWAKTTSIDLEANNITNARVRVADTTGQTPYRYQPSLIDPIGRTVTLRLRRVF